MLTCSVENVCAPGLIGSIELWERFFQSSPWVFLSRSAQANPASVETNPHPRVQHTLDGTVIAAAVERVTSARDLRFVRGEDTGVGDGYAMMGVTSGGKTWSCRFLESNAGKLWASVVSNAYAIERGVRGGMDAGATQSLHQVTGPEMSFVLDIEFSYDICRPVTTQPPGFDSWKACITECFSADNRLATLICTSLGGGSPTIDH